MARTAIPMSRGPGWMKQSAQLSDARVIFRAQPAMPSKRLGGKTGGRIAIAPDGSLFVTIGDRSDSPPWDVAQRLDNHLGKVIHITPDGAPAPDNPFLGKPGVLPEIWAYGIAQSGRPGIRSENRAIVGKRARSARRRRVEHHREGQELRMASDRPRHRLSGHADRRRHHAQGRHGGAGLLLGSGDRALGPRFLYRHSVSAVEGQRLRRRSALA